eukprot:TRINITY_DN4018_c0_g1_i1.p2 TRINITY_DN4018_c0_g1~~TRINITY_DN4018_c0_g1_i1.p2  ORF type:complete len:204 (-),score=34.75 TRINITY_DN4018_c0_g1_i1:343-954(-)
MCIRDRYEKLDSNIGINPSGAGLGLPICKKLTEIMGGTIHVKSTLNKGTTVSFSIEDKAINSFLNDPLLGLPLLDEEESMLLENKEDFSPRVRRSITHSATRPYLEYWKIKKSMKVLVVDDDYTCAFAVQNYFKLRCMECDMVVWVLKVGIVWKGGGGESEGTGEKGAEVCNDSRGSQYARYERNRSDTANPAVQKIQHQGCK